MASTTAPTRRPRLALALSALLALGALVVAGCSSDSEPSSSKPKATTTTTKADAKPTTTLAPVDLSGIDDPAAKYAAALGPMIVTYSGASGAAATKGAECLGPKWVKIITVKGFADAGVTPEDLQTQAVGLPQLDLSEAQAKKMAAGFGPCDLDLRDGAIAGISAGAPLSDEARACLKENLSEAFVEDGFVASLTGGKADDSSLGEIRECLGG